MIKLTPKILLLFIFIISTFSASAQYYLSARVKDKKTNKALPYCSVGLYENDSTGKFAITDKDGYFEIPAKSGKYMLIVRFMGYKTDSLSVTMERKNKFLGTIKLEETGIQLEGVEVKASTKDIDIDKQEVLVTNQMRTAAASARDVLDKVEGVTYDRYKDAIKVDNDGNVIILVNGLEKDQAYVKDIDPDRIARIEVIRDPSGRYGVEGYSAIINIILKQNYVGQELYIGANNIFDYKAPSPDLVMPIQNYWGGYTFSRKNLNIYTRAYIGRTTFGLPNTIETKYSSGLDIKQEIPDDMERNMMAHQSYNNITLGADYQIDAKNTISMEMGGNISPTTPSNFDYRYDFYKNDSIFYSSHYESKSETSSSSYYASAFYIGNYSSTKSLKADFTFGNSQSENTTDFGFTDSVKTRNKTQTGIYYTNANIEWTQALSKKFSWQAGFGSKWKKSENNNTISDSATFHRLNEWRNKAFAYGIWRISDKLQMKVGLASENNYSTFDQYERSLWLFKPHFDFFYKPSQMFNVKLKYRVNSNYPSISQTDPTEIQSDLYHISKGNPKLKPTNIHRFSLRFNIMQGLVSLEPYYEVSRNYITSVGYLRSDGMFVSTYGNSGLFEEYGTRLNITIPIGKSIFWQNSARLYHSEISYDSLHNSLSDWRGESQLFYTNRKIDLMAGIIYQRNNSKTLSLQGYQNQQNDYWGLLVQKSFFKKSLNIMLMAFLPIDWGAEYTQTQYLETSDYSQTVINDINILKQLVMIRINYRFHKGKEISTINKDVEKEEIKKEGGLF